jgi:hypothetical protein
MRGVRYNERYTVLRGATIYSHSSNGYQGQ